MDPDRRQCPSPLTHLPLCPIWYHFESDRVPSVALTISAISMQQRVVLWWTHWRSYGVVMCKVRALNLKLEFYAQMVNAFCVVQSSWF